MYKERPLVYAAVNTFKNLVALSELLGTVLLGSVSVNLEQMKAGAAWHFKRYAADAPEIERIQYEAAEAEAREAKHVLWQQQQAMQPLEWLHWGECVRLLA